MLMGWDYIHRASVHILSRQQLYSCGMKTVIVKQHVNECGRLCPIKTLFTKANHGMNLFFRMKLVNSSYKETVITECIEIVIVGIKIPW